MAGIVETDDYPSPRAIALRRRRSGPRRRDRRGSSLRPPPATLTFPLDRHSFRIILIE
ncbi:MAG: hypothetical protein FWG50_05455 [Kiritimatiellaeota bacterium]|nr:hypothetical protein [Kiritimatiellota bacterium]